MKSNIWAGITIIIISLIFFGSFYLIKTEMDETYRQQMINYEGGSCINEDGTCIHDNPLDWLFYLIYILDVVLFFVGVFLIVHGKNEIRIAEKLDNTAESIKRIKEKEENDNSFEAFLTPFSEEERKILRLIRNNEGLWQSTLRIKSGISKAKLSSILSELEEKGHITRQKKGKTYTIYLKQ